MLDVGKSSNGENNWSNIKQGADSKPVKKWGKMKMKMEHSNVYHVWRYFENSQMLVDIVNPLVPELPRSINLSFYPRFAKQNFGAKVF